MLDANYSPNFFDPQTHLFVKDVELSERFYIENFGFKETFRSLDKDTNKPDHVEIYLGQFGLGLSSISAAESVHGIKVGTGLPRGELLFWTENVDDVYQRLLANGAKGFKEPENFRKLRPARVTDPDGIMINIVSRRK